MRRNERIGQRALSALVNYEISVHYELPSPEVITEYATSRFHSIVLLAYRTHTHIRAMHTREIFSAAN